MDEGTNDKPGKVHNQLNYLLKILVEGSNTENKLAIFNVKTVFKLFKLILVWE